jgi:bacterioferritin
MVEKTLEVEEIIRILNEDFVREIEATMIYVRNAFVMDQCDSSRVTEDIAVDEMSMEHKELEFGGDDLRSQLERQIVLETEGIERYKQQIDAIDDAEVVGVLKHILDEEKRHRKEFRMRLERINE